jgi:voltage-gated potassium channel Kch
MGALLGAFSLVFSFFRDLADVFRDPRTRVVLVWVLILLTVGTVFYAVVEGWTLVDAFYFSVVTLTTVGYGDLSPATTIGKLFTTIYIFLGISVIVVFANAMTKKHATRLVKRVDRDDVAQSEETGGKATEQEVADG